MRKYEIQKENTYLKQPRRNQDQDHPFAKFSLVCFYRYIFLEKIA